MTSPPTQDILRGRRIAITRTGDQASSLIEQLEALHAEPIVCSAISIVPPADYTPIDTALRSISRYHWIIFTSANAVRAFIDRCDALDIPRHHLRAINIAAVGTTTAHVIEQAGMAVTLIPKPFVARALLDTLGTRVIGKRILLPRANIAKSDLPMELRNNGAIVDELIMYRTEPGSGITDLLSRVRADTIDAITFASSSAVRYFSDGAKTSDPSHPTWLDAVWQSSNRPAIVCIGPVTAATARTLNVPVDAVAEEYDADGLVRALAAWFSTHPSHS